MEFRKQRRAFCGFSVQGTPSSLSVYFDWCFCGMKGAYLHQCFGSGTPGLNYAKSQMVTFNIINPSNTKFFFVIF